MLEICFSRVVSDRRHPVGGVLDHDPFHSCPLLVLLLLLVVVVVIRIAFDLDVANNVQFVAWPN